MRSLVDYIKNGASVEEINYKLTKYAEYNELFINYAYHGGSNYDSEFWRITKEKTKKILYEKFDWENARKQVIEEIKKHGISPVEGAHGWSTYHWMEWEKYLQYNYFKD